jgi:hypothetical protein
MRGLKETLCITRKHFEMQASSPFLVRCYPFLFSQTLTHCPGSIFDMLESLLVGEISGENYSPSKSRVAKTWGRITSQAFRGKVKKAQPLVDWNAHSSLDNSRPNKKKPVSLDLEFRICFLERIPAGHSMDRYFSRISTKSATMHLAITNK